MKIKFRPSFLPLLKVLLTSLLSIPPVYHSSWLVIVVNFMRGKERTQFGLPQTFRILKRRQQQCCEEVIGWMSSKYKLMTLVSASYFYQSAVLSKQTDNQRNKEINKFHLMAMTKSMLMSVSNFFILWHCTSLHKLCPFDNYTHFHFPNTGT